MRTKAEFAPSNGVPSQDKAGGAMARAVECRTKPEDGRWCQRVGCSIGSNTEIVQTRTDSLSLLQ